MVPGTRWIHIQCSGEGDGGFLAQGPPVELLVAAGETLHRELLRAGASRGAQPVHVRAARERSEQLHRAQHEIRSLRMENTYLASTGQTPNTIFRRAAGSDVDIFTIGFHRSFEAFAAPADVTVEEKERAARDAGFNGLADISFYLRSLISGHHDTLAVKVD